MSDDTATGGQQDTAPEMGREETIPLGIVITRRPGVTRWAKHSWRVTAVLPGAGPGDWQVLQEQDGVVDYHAATLPVTLYRAETEAYRVALSNTPPIVYVVLRPNEGEDSATRPYVPFLATASPFEAQDYADSAEELVEPVAMPPALIGFISRFVSVHHRDEQFRKRRRDRVRVEQVEDGRGDARVRQDADVYRSPASRRAAIEQARETTHLATDPFEAEIDHEEGPMPGPSSPPGRGRLH